MVLVMEGVVLKGDGVYYKIFDDDYCRKDNFIKAYEAGFFDEVAPALQSLIEHNGEIVGYTMEAEKLLMIYHFISIRGFYL